MGFTGAAQCSCRSYTGTRPPPSPSYTKCTYPLAHILLFCQAKGRCSLQLYRVQVKQGDMPDGEDAQGEGPGVTEDMEDGVTAEPLDFSAVPNKILKDMGE